MASTFRADIEGLRAVAVLLVVLYHAGVSWVPGGYVGVDVFFVLSGYLITGLLWREIQETGRISLRSFYARRIRRLLPLSATVLVLTVAVGALVLPPLRAFDLTADAKAAALYVANVRFAASEADYFKADVPPSALLHYWSLAVEEQFYVLWPLLLLVARRRLAWVVAVVTVVGVASFAACVVVTDTVQPTAYFLLPTRAWELAAGGGLALAAPRLRPRQAAPVAWAGLAAIGWAAATFSERTAFPGAAALVPVLGTVALLCACGSGPAHILTMGPLRQAGRWSYAWYLWHWPVLVLAGAAVDRTLSTVENLALAASSFWLAAATHYVIENPVRFSLRLPAFRVGAALTSIAVGVPVLVASGLPSLEGTGVAAPTPVFAAPPPTVTTTTTTTSPTTTSTSPSRTPASRQRRPAIPATTTPARVLSPLEQALAARVVPSNLSPSLSKASEDKPRLYGDGCHRGVRATETEGCVYGVADAPKTVVLFGDSHAAHWFPALERVAMAQQWRLVSMTKSGCPPVDAPVYSPDVNREYTECETWRNGVLERIEAEKADLVVMSMARAYAHSGLARDSEAWRAALVRTVTKVRETGARTVVLGPTPKGVGDVPACLSAHMNDIQACVKPTAELVDANAARAEAGAIAGAGGTSLELVGLMCLDRCPTIIGNLLVYRDDSHLTTTFATSMADAFGTLLAG